MLAQGIREVGGPEIEVANVPGKNQSLAWQAVNDAAPDGHVIGTASNVLLTSHLTGKSTLHYSQFTPVALLVEEYLSFAVAASRATSTDWLRLLKSGELPLRVGFIGRTENARHLAIATALIAHGQDMSQVVFQGYETEEEALRDLASGRNHVYCDTASAVAVLVKSGVLHPVAVSAQRRLPDIYKNTPCLAEVGIKNPFTAWRAMVGPPGMPREETAFWENTFKALSGTVARFRASSFLGSAKSDRLLAKDSGHVKLCGRYAPLNMAMHFDALKVQVSTQSRMSAL